MTDRNISADNHSAATLLPLLKSIVVPGNRESLHENKVIEHLLRHMENEDINTNIECVSMILSILSQLLDRNLTELSSETVKISCRHAVVAMELFPENRDILTSAAGVIWVCAASHATECLGEGAYSALENASKVNHFANLEVGSRHPFRFKLGIISHALSRLTET